MEITVLDFEKNINFPATKELLTIFQAPCRLYSQKIKANQKNMVLIKMELAIQSCFPFQALLSIIFKNLCYTKILESFRVKKIMILNCGLF